jgi:outer membrane immunogenic protein
MRISRIVFSVAAAITAFLGISAASAAETPADSQAPVSARVQSLENELAAVKRENQLLQEIKAARAENSALSKGQPVASGGKQKDPRAAYAADMPVPYAKAPAMIEPVASWTGFYIGINGGGEWSRTNTSWSNSPATGFFGPALAGSSIMAAGSNRIDNSGWFAGGHAGYLFETGKIILGLEGSFDWMNAKGSVSNTVFLAPLAPAGQGFNISESAKTEWLALFLGRIGYDMGAWFPYVTGGAAVASLKYQANYLDNIPPAFASSATIRQVALGPVIGAGIEWRWDSHWSLRGEYLIMEFALDGTAPVVNTVTGLLLPGQLYVHSAAFKESLGRFAVSYKF